MCQPSIFSFLKCDLVPLCFISLMGSKAGTFEDIVDAYLAYLQVSSFKVIAFKLRTKVIVNFIVYFLV